MKSLVLRNCTGVVGPVPDLSAWNNLASLDISFSGFVSSVAAPLFLVDPNKLILPSLTQLALGK